MNENEYELFSKLSDYEKNFYTLLKKLDIDVSINTGDTIDERFNIPEADMPKIHALAEFFKFIRYRK